MMAMIMMMTITTAMVIVIITMILIIITMGCWCPNYTNAFSVWEHILFDDAFSPITHTKIPKNFRKRYQKWSLLKTHRFENFPFRMWTGGIEAFANCAEKSVSVFGRFRVDDRRKRIKKYTFSNKNAPVWTGKTKRKLKFAEKYFASFWLSFWKRVTVAKA